MGAYRVTLGATVSLGQYNAARIEVSFEDDDFDKAKDTCQRLFYRTAFEHCTQLREGFTSPQNSVEFLARAALEIKPRGKAKPPRKRR